MGHSQKLDGAKPKGVAVREEEAQPPQGTARTFVKGRVQGSVRVLKVLL
jgi:hypothetical protein